MPFQKGKVANPSGRPKAQSGLAAQIARWVGDATHDGEELVRRLLMLSRGCTTMREMRELTPEQWRTGAMRDGLSADRVRLALAATQELLDRGAGKAQASLVIEDDRPAALDPAAVAAEMLRQASPELWSRLEQELGDDEPPAPGAPASPSLQ